MNLPSKLAEQRDELSLKQHIYETKYGGKDHSGYDTKMLYEINYDREEAFDIGFNKACEILLPEMEKMKAALDTFIKLNNSIKENPHNVGEEYELAIEGLEESLQSYREVIGDD